MDNYLKNSSVSNSINEKSINSFIAKLLSSKEIIPETFQIDLELDKELDFQPGQYAWLKLSELEFPDPKGDKRAFSLIRNSSDKKTISFIFRKSESGFKKTLLNLKPGAEMSIEGPRGFFTLNEINSPTVMIAGGVGITPFISILEYLSVTNSTRKVLLFVNNLSNDRRVYSEQIENLVKNNPNLNVYELIGENLSWGFIEKNLQEYNFNISDAIWYVSGPVEMVDSVYKILETQNINPDKIMLDEFKPNIEKFNELVAKMHTPEGTSIFKLAIEAFSVHVIIADPEGRIIFANAAAEKATGYKLEEMIGNTPRLWGGIMNKDYYSKMWNTIKNDQIVFTGQVVNKRKNGEMYVADVHISPIIQNHKLFGYIATEFEVTEMLKRQSDLTEKITEYEKLNKLMVDREIRMMELKKQIDNLKGK